MTTPYGISRSNGIQKGFVNTPIIGPLNSTQYPFTMPFHSYGRLNGLRPTPPQFFSSQEPVNSQMYSNARSHYLRASGLNTNRKVEQEFLAKGSEPMTNYISSSNKRVPVSKHMNYIQPMQSSMKTNIMKSVAIGKSSYKIGLPLESSIGSKNYDTSYTRTALRRARSSGNVAPKKKGSIYNSMQSSVNGWGAIPRMNY